MEQNKDQNYAQTEEKKEVLEEKENLINIGLAIVVIVIIVLGGFWLYQKYSADDYMSTSFENIEGVQGIITGADWENKIFSIHRSKLLEKDGEYSTKDDYFTFTWDEETGIFQYNNAADVKNNNKTLSGISRLKEGALVIVTPAEEPVPNIEILAREIIIMP